MKSIWKMLIKNEHKVSGRFINNNNCEKMIGKIIDLSNYDHSDGLNTNPSAISLSKNENDIIHLLEKEKK